MSFRRFLAVSLLVVASGCQSLPGSEGFRVKAGPATSPTGGVGIYFSDADPKANSYCLYRLDPSGLLSVSGGQEAMRDEWEWSGEPSEAQRVAILDALDRSGLGHGELACTDIDGGRVTVIEVAQPSGADRYRWKGNCPALDPLREAFRAAAMARFNRELDALPEPGPRPEVRR